MFINKKLTRIAQNFKQSRIKSSFVIFTFEIKRNYDANGMNQLNIINQHIKHLF